MAQSFFAAGINSILGSVTAAADFAASWGDKISWVGLMEGLQKAKSEQKMAVVIVSKDRCAACNQLKKRFRESRELHKLAQKFVMIRVAPDEVGSNIKYKPDGNYIPRVLFLDSSGRLMKDVVRDPHVTKWKYNYATEEQLLANMRKVLESASYDE